jgi:hypothetical protein
MSKDKQLEKILHDAIEIDSTDNFQNSDFQNSKQLIEISDEMGISRQALFNAIEKNSSSNQVTQFNMTTQQLKKLFWDNYKANSHTFYQVLKSHEIKELETGFIIYRKKNPNQFFEVQIFENEDGTSSLYWRKHFESIKTFHLALAGFISTICLTLAISKTQLDFLALMGLGCITAFLMYLGIMKQLDVGMHNFVGQMKNVEHLSE